MALELGAQLKYPNLKPWFNHPCRNEKVHIFLDVSHVIKLIRNTIGDWQCLVDDKNNMISWKFFKYLVDWQEKVGLHTSNKITKRHLNFRKEIMKVSLTVQVFSNSVADALDYMNKDLKIADFKNSEHTAKFCRIMNNTFDILNSRNFLSKGIWNKPFSVENEDVVKQFLNEVVSYVSSITTLDGTSILQSRRKTGFLGLIISIRSKQNLFDDIVKVNKHLQYILTYKMSQDHLEMLFAVIRSRGRFNNNPTAVQFEGAYKRLLVPNEIGSVETSNCVKQDVTSILTVSSSNSNNIDALLSIENDAEDINPIDNIKNEADNIIYTETTTQHIYDVVLKKLLNKLTVLTAALYCLPTKPSLCF